MSAARFGTMVAEQMEAIEADHPDGTIVGALTLALVAPGEREPAYTRMRSNVPPPIAVSMLYGALGSSIVEAIGDVSISFLDFSGEDEEDK